MQVELLALLLLQPERSWTMSELADVLGAPQSSVHRELGRAEEAAIVERQAEARPHRFRAARDEPIVEPLADLLQRSVGVESQLRAVLDRPDVRAAVIHGSWADGQRRPGSDIDVLVVGQADLRELRRRVRPVGNSVGRTIDLTVLTVEELQSLLAERSSFVRQVLEAPTVPLVGELADLTRR